MIFVYILQIIRSINDKSKKLKKNVSYAFFSDVHRKTTIASTTTLINTISQKNCSYNKIISDMVFGITYSYFCQQTERLSVCNEWNMWKQ